MSDHLLMHLKSLSGFEFVPDGWEYDRVGNRCDLGRGRVISQIEISSNPGKYPVYSSQTSNEGCMGYLDKYDFEGEYATWTTDGANAGTVFYRNGQFNCTNVCGTIKPKKKDSIDLKFLTYHLNQITKRYVSYHGNPKLMNDIMAGVAITIPPFEEQRTIATILDSIDNAIVHTKQMIEKLQRVKVGLLHDLLTRGLDDNGELRDPVRHPEQFKDSPLGWMPLEWDVGALGSYILLISGQHIDAADCTNNPKHVPYLTGPADFPDGMIIISKYTSKPKVMCKAGDILITVKGSGTGKTVVACSDYCISRQLMAVRAGSCDQRFLSIVLESFTKSLRADATGLIPGIAREDLLSKVTGFPPIPEQQRIADILDKFDHNVNQEKSHLGKITKLKQGLMRDLLSGKVSVTPLIGATHG